jgi:ABC-2 type transport system permease protein
MEQGGAALLGGGLVSWLRLIFAFARIGALDDLAYRTNFWVQAFESLVSLGSALGAVALVFSRTETLGGWEPAELLAVVGVYFIVLGGVQVVIAPSLTRFIEDVRQGTLDFTLTKPQDAQLLVSISEVRFWKLVDVLLGAGVLIAAALYHPDEIGVHRVPAFALALAAGGAIVYAVWLALASTAFWFVRVENVMMIFYSLYAAGRWPVHIYPGWLRLALTVIVPVAFAVTVPAEALVGRLDAGTLGAALGIAALCLAASRWLFMRGLRRYSGASA